jgi:hypothetical protein
MRLVVAMAACAILAGCMSAAPTRTVIPADDRSRQPALGVRADARPLQGIYVSTGSDVYGYAVTDRESKPPICTIHQPNGYGDRNISVDRAGNLLVPHDLAVAVYTGPKMCGTLALDAGYGEGGRPMDVASLDAMHARTAIAAVNYSSSGYGTFSFCTLAQSSHCVIPRMAPQLYDSSAVTIDHDGNCWVSGWTWSGSQVLYYVRRSLAGIAVGVAPCVAGVSTTGTLNVGFGGLDIDHQGHLVTIDPTKNGRVFVYEGCDPGCRLIGGPFPLRHPGRYGHLNHAGTLFAVATSTGVDVYTYSLTALTYAYTFATDISNITGVAFSPGR